VVDGAQAAGAIPFRFDELGADLYAVPAHTWLLGPEGMAALVASPTTIDGATPALARWDDVGRLDGNGNPAWWREARRSEGSDFHRPSIVGMARSIGWLSMYVGLDFVHRRGTATARAALARLAGIPGVTVLTPDHAMATLVTFRIAGWPAQAALDELGSRTFVIARTVVPLDAIRLSIGFFTSDEEVERVAEAVAVLASHTPETLPPRRVLTILGEG
jgi:selenocysteine lyase/cysteine desulfurase